MVRCVCVCARAIVGAMERATHLEAFRIGMRGGAVGFFSVGLLSISVKNLCRSVEPGLNCLTAGLYEYVALFLWGMGRIRATKKSQRAAKYAAYNLPRSL